MRKMVKKLFGTMLAVCLLSGCLSGVVSAEKTYVNEEKWGFETDEWGLSTGSVKDEHVFYNTDKQYVLSGERSLKIVGDAEKADVGVQTAFSKNVAGSGIKQYVTGKIKADLDAGSKLVVALYYQKVGPNYLLTSTTVTTDCDWTDIYLAAANDHGYNVHLAILMTGTGTVYADNFKLVQDNEDNMTYNPTFEPSYITIGGWNAVSGRGSWGTEWNYDATCGALKYHKGVSWAYLNMPASTEKLMQSGEIYKVSIRYKTTSTAAADLTPALYARLNGHTYPVSEGKIILSAVGSPDVNEFTQYVGYYILPEGKTHVGYYLQGGSDEAWYDDFYVVKDNTGAPYVEDASGNGTVEAGEIVTAKMHLAEKDETNVQLVIAVYSKVGGATMLEAVNIAPYKVGATVPADDDDPSTITLGGDIAVSATAPIADKEYTAKAFCWDADNMLTPLP